MTPLAISGQRQRRRSAGDSRPTYTWRHHRHDGHLALRRRAPPHTTAAGERKPLALHGEAAPRSAAHASRRRASKVGVGAARTRASAPAARQIRRAGRARQRGAHVRQRACMARALRCTISTHCCINCSLVNGGAPDAVRTPGSPSPTCSTLTEMSLRSLCETQTTSPALTRPAACSAKCSAERSIASSDSPSRGSASMGMTPRRSSSARQAATPPMAQRTPLSAASVGGNSARTGTLGRHLATCGEQNALLRAEAQAAQHTNSYRGSVAAAAREDDDEARAGFLRNARKRGCHRVAAAHACHARANRRHACSVHHLAEEFAVVKHALRLGAHGQHARQRLDGEQAAHSFGAEHKRVHAIQHRVGHVGGLGARGPRRIRHRVENARHHDQLARKVAAPHNLFL